LLGKFGGRFTDVDDAPVVKLSNVGDTELTDAQSGSLNVSATSPLDVMCGTAKTKTTSFHVVVASLPLSVTLLPFTVRYAGEYRTRAVGLAPDIPPGEQFHTLAFICTVGRFSGVDMSNLGIPLPMPSAWLPRHAFT
jgi:hypothetical protein